MNLITRKIHAETVRNSLAGVTEDAEVVDLFAILEQWESGTLHGIAPWVPDPPSDRPSSHIP